MWALGWGEAVQASAWWASVRGQQTIHWGMAPDGALTELAERASALPVAVAQRGELGGALIGAWHGSYSVRPGVWLL